MKEKIILFDLDGVLVLSEDVHFKSWLLVLKQCGLKEELLSYDDVFGISDKTIAELVVKKTGNVLDPDLLCLLKKEIYLSNYVSLLKPPPGRDDFLKLCKDVFKMAVVSSATRSEITTVLKTQNIEHYFQFFIGFEDVRKPKPDPEPYLLALKKFNIVQPFKAIAIEDSQVGIASALSAGLKVYGFGGVSNERFPNVPFSKDYFSLKSKIFS